MDKINICIIGAGNISNTRHIPAILKNKIKPVGVISITQDNINRTLNKYPFFKYSLLINELENIEEQLKNSSWFMNNIDAVVIGTPPKSHFSMVKACLNLDKHVLIEKPMMMSVSECDDVIELSERKKKILNVVHSFQYAHGIMKLEKIVKHGDLGEINSIVEIQFSNRTRRLPVWYNDLPLGLFYDEAAHFFYSAMRFGGDLRIENANIQESKIKGNTPCHLSVQAYAGNIPVQMYMNFDAPLCEWYLLLLGTKKMALYDFFKDILIILDNDQQHLAFNVLKTSKRYSIEFWKQFIKNGFQLITNNLLYGHDKVIRYFLDAIKTKKSSPLLSAELGKKVVTAMNNVVNLAKNNN